MYCSNVGGGGGSVPLAMIGEMIFPSRAFLWAESVDGSGAVDALTTLCFVFLRFFRSRLLNRRFLRVLPFSIGALSASLNEALSASVSVISGNTYLVRDLGMDGGDDEG